jgi:hypothetical protein
VFGDEFYQITVRARDVVVDDSFPLSVGRNFPAPAPPPITFGLSPPEAVAVGRVRSGEESSVPASFAS